jgi:integrase
MEALKVGDISFKEPDPFINVRHGKGNKKRTVYIDQKLAKYLKEFINYKTRSLNQSLDITSGRKEI